MGRVAQIVVPGEIHPLGFDSHFYQCYTSTIFRRIRLFPLPLLSVFVTRMRPTSPVDRLTLRPDLAGAGEVPQAYAW